MRMEVFVAISTGFYYDINACLSHFPPKYETYIDDGKGIFGFS